MFLVEKVVALATIAFGLLWLGWVAPQPNGDAVARSRAVERPAAHLQ